MKELKIDEKRGGGFTWGVEYHTDKSGAVRVVLIAVDSKGDGLKMWFTGAQAKVVGELLIRGAARLEE